MLDAYRKLALLFGKVFFDYFYNCMKIVGCNAHTSDVTIINRLLEK